MKKKLKKKTPKPHVWTPAELASIGFAFCADMGRIVHVEGDEVGDALIARIDRGEYTIDQARADARARRERAMRMEHNARR